VPSLVTLPPGAVFHGRYQVIRCLGAGGMGAIHEVLDSRTSRYRVLKTMLPSLAADADLRARFEREARVTAGIDSEHLVETFDAGVDEETGTPFLVMELLRGESLAETIARRGRLPGDEVVALLDQVARALDRTHEAGIVHRDLKPANLFMARREDGPERVKILDFGIAKIVADGTPAEDTTRSLGTPTYMSPEQVRGEGTIDPRADVYALGQIAYTLLVGEPYWHEEARGQNVYPLLMKIAEGMREPATIRAARRGVTVPAAFDAWFSVATAKEAGDRWETAGQLVSELATALAVTPGDDASTRTLDPTAMIVAPRRRHGLPLLVAAACIGALVLLVGGLSIARSRAGAMGNSANASSASPPPRVAGAMGTVVPQPAQTLDSHHGTETGAPSAAAATPGGAKARAGSPAAAARPLSPATASVPTALASPDADRQGACDPWFTIDSRGRQVPKAGCN
jgi:serine/threonine-protein kinase